MFWNPSQLFYYINFHAEVMREYFSSVLSLKIHMINHFILHDLIVKNARIFNLFYFNFFFSGFGHWFSVLWVLLLFSLVRSVFIWLTWFYTMNTNPLPYILGIFFKFIFHLLNLFIVFYYPCKILCNRICLFLTLRFLIFISCI